MSDLLAKCDWLNGAVLVMTLPQDPSSIHVKLFDSKHAPSKVYVPESYPHQWELGADYMRLGKENEKLQVEIAELQGTIECLKGLAEANYERCDTCEAMLDCDECLRADASHKELRGLQAENEKLRELCRHLYACNQYCDREDSDGGCSACPYQLLEYDCGFEERLLELGIEVES